MRHGWILGAALCVVAIPAQASTVRDFLGRADALEAQGPLALLSPDYKLLKGEAKAASNAYRAQLDAQRRAGRKPASCPPPPSETKITPEELLDGLRAIPPRQRGMSLEDGIGRIMRQRYPCR